MYYVLLVILRVMVSLQKSVAPSTRAVEGPVLENRWTIQHLFFFAIGFEPVISPRPDTVLLANFTFTLTGPTTRSVTLVFHTLGFGT